jgi:FkbM family methyltransferase
MLIPLRHLKEYWGIAPTGTLHVGAHLGEEQADYQRYGFAPTIWIEAQAELAQELKLRVHAPSIVIQAVAWNTDGEEMSFKVTNNGQSSSVFDFGSHKDHYPEINVQKSETLLSSRLDSILPSNLKPNFLNLDIQGAEYQALQGLGNLLHEFDYVYSEVNRDQLYDGIREVTEIDRYLAGFGFVRVATSWTSAGWGDALYLKKMWALTTYGSELRLQIRVWIYWIWGSLMKLSLRRLLSWVLGHVIRLSRSKSQ